MLHAACTQYNSLLVSKHPLAFKSPILSSRISAVIIKHPETKHALFIIRQNKSLANAVSSVHSQRTSKTSVLCTYMSLHKVAVELAHIHAKNSCCTIVLRSSRYRVVNIWQLKRNLFRALSFDINGTKKYWFAGTDRFFSLTQPID